MEAPKKSSKKNAAPSSKTKKGDDEDDDDLDLDEEVDDWNKVEEEEEWDPDFDEFDVPKSKSKKSAPSTGGAKKAAKEEDLDFDEDFKDLDLFGEERFDEEEDDDF